MVHYSVETAFQALADPARMAIVSRLAEGELSVSDLAAPLPMSLQAVRKHLAVLEGAGLVSSAKAGRVRTCRLETKPMQAAAVWLSDRAKLWESRLDNLARLVESKP